MIPADVLYSIGEYTALELKISPPRGHAEDAGHISVHCRPAEIGEKEIREKLAQGYKAVQRKVSGTWIGGYGKFADKLSQKLSLFLSLAS